MTVWPSFAAPADYWHDHFTGADLGGYWTSHSAVPVVGDYVYLYEMKRGHVVTKRQWMTRNGSLEVVLYAKPEDIRIPIEKSSSTEEFLLKTFGLDMNA